jgi:hypothetical protein
MALSLVFGVLFWADAAAAITAPELRGQRALQDLQPDMHGRNLQQQEFLKAQLGGFDFSGADLRGAVFNGSDLQGANLAGADLGDVVAYATRFDNSDAVLDLPEQKALCQRAAGTNPSTGVTTRDSLACRST